MRISLFFPSSRWYVLCPFVPTGMVTATRKARQSYRWLSTFPQCWIIQQNDNPPTKI